MRKNVYYLLRLAKAFRCIDWDPEKHPKGERGRFVKKPGGARGNGKSLDIQELSPKNGCRRFDVNGKVYTQVKLYPDEYALVMSEIDTWMNKEKEKAGRFSQYIDNSVYAILIVNLRKRDYVIVGRKPIR